MLWILACQPESPLITETLSDEGTWSIVVTEAQYSLGENKALLIVTESEQPAEDISLILHPWMPGMSMADLASLTGEPQKQGEYSFQLNFDMTGLWHLDGVVQHETLASERFTLVVEVL